MRTLYKDLNLSWDEIMRDTDLEEKRKKYVLCVYTMSRRDNPFITDDGSSAHIP